MSYNNDKYCCCYRRPAKNNGPGITRCRGRTFNSKSTPNKCQARETKARERNEVDSVVFLIFPFILRKLLWLAQSVSQLTIHLRLCIMPQQRRRRRRPPSLPPSSYTAPEAWHSHQQYVGNPVKMAVTQQHPLPGEIRSYHLATLSLVVVAAKCFWSTALQLQHVIFVASPALLITASKLGLCAENCFERVPNSLIPTVESVADSDDVGQYHQLWQPAAAAAAAPRLMGEKRHRYCKWKWSERVKRILSKNRLFLSVYKAISLPTGRLAEGRRRRTSRRRVKWIAGLIVKLSGRNDSWIRSGWVRNRSDNEEDDDKHGSSGNIIELRCSRGIILNHPPPQQLSPAPSAQDTIHITRRSANLTSGFLAHWSLNGQKSSVNAALYNYNCHQFRGQGGGGGGGKVSGEREGGELPKSIESYYGIHIGSNYLWIEKSDQELNFSQIKSSSDVTVLFCLSRRVTRTDDRHFRDKSERGAASNALLVSNTFHLVVILSVIIPASGAVVVVVVPVALNEKSERVRNHKGESHWLTSLMLKWTSLTSLSLARGNGNGGGSDGTERAAVKTNLPSLVPLELRKADVADEIKTKGKPDISSMEWDRKDTILSEELKTNADIYKADRATEMRHFKLSKGGPRGATVNGPIILFCRQDNKGRRLVLLLTIGILLAVNLTSVSCAKTPHGSGGPGSIKYSPNVVKTKYGPLRGIVLRSHPLVEAYLGVPYATPPVGSLR